MAVAQFTLQEDYWELFSLQEEDIEFLYNYLLEVETPLATAELLEKLIENRIRREKKAIESRRSMGGEVYLPKQTYAIDQELVFPALGWLHGKVVGKRLGNNPDLPPFEVLKVDLEDGDTKEFACGLEAHQLNNPVDYSEEDELLDLRHVIDAYGKRLTKTVEEELINNKEFVQIAGRWFPQALVVDVNVGHLNLAEAALDMEGGGPLPTRKLMETVDLPDDVNESLVEFSLDYALWKDPRFDEVGPAGEILWYLKRLEPVEVLEVPKFLEYRPIDFDRSLLTDEMLALEAELDDELSPLDELETVEKEVELSLIFPHWRVGSLPLSSRLKPLFPTAYQAPRIRFILVDGDTGEKFPGWVVRESHFVFGLREFYLKKGLLPGSLLRVRTGDRLGEVIVQAQTHRPTRDWLRTVLVGADGGIVLAMLKQSVAASFDERMLIAIPDVELMDKAWDKTQQERIPFERIVVNILRELSKLTPQGHVHARELYAAVNLIRRCPPAPLLALLASRSWFVHVGDLHFRFDDSEARSA